MSGPGGGRTILVVDNYDSFVYNLVQYLGELGASLPVLGVCLGHQVIGHVYGGRVGPAPELVHGKTSPVHHQGVGVLAGLPAPFAATRYHSLVVERDGLPAVLEVTGETEAGLVMALRHRHHPVEGVQFHPESVLTRCGHQLLANWLGTLGQGRPAA